MQQIRQAFYYLPKAKEEFLRKAINVAYSVKVDKLDCSESFARQPTSKTVEEVLQICLASRNTHYTCILRDETEYGGKKYYDIGASTIGAAPNYFLWIYVDVESAEKLIREYNLQPHE